jgi:hypothetical protein
VLGEGERLAWILGSSRSGSTWLLRMLAATGEVVPIDDPHLGHHLGVWRPIPLAWAAGREQPELTTLTDVKRDKPDYFFSDRYRDDWLPALRALVAARFGAQAREVAAAQGIREPTVVVKEPGSHAAELLLDLFPRAGLIFLLRDGRDVVDSWVDAYQDGSWAQEEGAFAVTPEGRLPLIRWLASVWVFRTEAVLRTFQRQDAGRRLVIRYEDLLDDTPGQLERVVRMLGLRIGEDRVERAARELEFDRAEPRERGDGKAMRTAAPGSWRHNLSPAEQRAMLEILGPTLRGLGYPEVPRHVAEAA